MKKLYFGDCLDVLKELHREHPEGFIDLIYIDPPFNSKRDYNVLFESVNLTDSTAQKQAFADTWSNVGYLDTLNEIQSLDLDLYQFLQSLDSIRVSKSAVAYLTTMAIRIHYMHKVLKETGSFYLHCDPKMSHYLKLVCDVVFGERNFRNEVAWHYGQRTDVHDGHFSRKHDIVLFYARSHATKINPVTKQWTREEFIKHRHDVMVGDDGEEFIWTDGGKKGKRYRRSVKDVLAEGKPLDDVWDIPLLNSSAKERMGYPTQKPEALLENIVNASSNDGDIVADFFCGCGTTIAVAEHLNRNWIGADISHLAIKLVYKRLRDHYRGNRTKLKELNDAVEVHGLPRDIASAKELAQNVAEGRFGFQDWVIEVMLGGVSNEKKVADGGFDGYLTFSKLDKKKEVVLIEVKSGNVNVKNVREFIQVVTARKAAMGVFVCFAEHVTKPMLLWAKKEGYYDSDTWGDRFDKIQIVTVEDLLNGDGVNCPTSTVGTFKTANKKRTKGGDQLELTEE